MKDHALPRRNFLKTRTIDLTFTVVLGLFTFVFGYYVYSFVRSVKIAKPKKALVAAAVPHRKAKHHKYKHHLKIAFKTWPLKIAIVDTAKVLPTVKAQIYTGKNSIASPPFADHVSNKTKPADEIAVTEKDAVKEANLPYTTYLKANETGVINMRKFDNYGSEVIKVIPTNSLVEVLEKGPVYYKVLFENTTGYVPKWNILKK